MSDKSIEAIREALQEFDEDIVSEIAEAPRYSCTLGGAYSTVLATVGAIPLLHSGGGCGFGQWFSLSQGAGVAGPVGKFGACAAPCSSLLEEHVVFGGEEKLRNLIRSSIELLNAELFVVIPGCIPSLIGDDIEAVVDEFRNDVPIVNLDTAGFKGNSYDGYDAFLEAIINQLLPEISEEEKDDVQVNIFGIVPAQHVFWRGDLQEIKKLLATIGVKANIIFGEQNGLEKLKKIPYAKHNIVLSPRVGLKTAEQLKEKYGTEFTVFPSAPVGPLQSTEFIKKVGKILDVPEDKVNAVAEFEEKEVFDSYQYMADSFMIYLPNAYFGVAADSSTAIGITKYLTNEASYIPEIVVVTDNPPEEYHETITKELTEDIKSIQKPIVIFEKDSHEIRKQLRDRKFQYLLSSSMEKFLAQTEFFSGHLSVSYPIYDRLIVYRSYVGYRGGFTLMEDILSKVVGAV